jgi:heterotetrameric sarcosine oxidase gamma subunit
MSLEFLSPHPDGEPAPGAPEAASPVEPWLSEAGARFEHRHGWRVAVDFGAPAEELEACRRGVGIGDRSALGKFELQGRPRILESVLEGVLAEGPPGAGETARLDDALLWASSPDRALAICEPAATPRIRELLEGAAASPRCGLVEVTAGFAAFELRGPRSGELLERLTAIDVRPDALPPGGVRAGAVAEVPAVLLRPEPGAFLVVVSAPEAPDAWEIALDVGAPLGLRPVGEAARVGAQPRVEGAPAHA